MKSYARLAQLVRAPRLHRGGRGFESLSVHKMSIVIYEDKNLLVLNKPAGLAVHGDGYLKEATLADWLIEKYPELSDVGEPIFSPKGEKIDKPGLVHRLDKDTSGVLLAAKNQAMFLFLKKQFQEHMVKKTYNLIVEGTFKDLNVSKTIDLPIGRSKKDPRMRVASRKAHGVLRPAVTDYTALENLQNDTALVEAMPRSGRTHQLRAHFKAINHPLLCDKLYNSQGHCEPPLLRQALHASKIEIAMPDGERRTFEAPWPEDMTLTLEKLRVT